MMPGLRLEYFYAINTETLPETYWLHTRKPVFCTPCASRHGILKLLSEAVVDIPILPDAAQPCSVFAPYTRGSVNNEGGGAILTDVVYHSLQSDQGNAALTGLCFCKC